MLFQKYDVLVVGGAQFDLRGSIPSVWQLSRSVWLNWAGPGRTTALNVETVSLSFAGAGLLLLVLRTTPAMGILLALHIGIVFALFVTMPYGKFVHGIYRFLALVRYAKEAREFATISD